MAVIPTNTPGQRSDFNAPIFTEAVGKSMLLCVPKTDAETVFRVIPELNAQGQPVPMCRTYDATGHDFSSLTLEQVAVTNGVIGKFTGSVIPGRVGDTSGAPDTGIPEPDLPFKGLYIRLKGRVKKNQVPIELQSAVTQLMQRVGNRPPPLDVSAFVIVQAWILKDNGVLCVDPNTKQPQPRRGLILLKASAAQAMKVLLTELFTAGIDAYDPNAGMCFMIHGFPPKTFPGQELASAYALPCTMQGQPLTFRGHTPPATPAGRPPAQYAEFTPATASPLPASFWQGANAFVDWNKVIRRHTLQELFKKQLECFGPSICAFAFPNEYGSLVQPQGFQPQQQPQQGFQQPSFGQQPQQGFQPQQPQQPQQQPQQPSFGQQPQMGQPPAFQTQPTFQQPQQPSFGQASFGQTPQQPQQGFQQPQQPSFSQPPVAPQQPSFGAPAPQQPSFGQQAPQQPVSAFGAPPLQQAVNPAQQQPTAPQQPQQGFQQPQQGFGTPPQN